MAKKQRAKTDKQSYDEELYRIRHSAAHVMAQAVLEMFPEGKIAIGPPIENGFYYDFDLPRPLTPEDLEKIEERMREIIKGKHPFIRREVTPEEARELFKDQPYKLELIEDILSRGTDEYGNPLPEGEQPKLTTYRHDTFEDLCRGPHVEHTGQIPVNAFKLLNVAGAYWRGDERRPMLQRIYGTAWKTPKELRQYLNWLEEIKKRDHRRLGKELDLFSTHPDVGAGLILWHPKGAFIRHKMEEFAKEEHLKHGYVFVYTPHIGKSLLWERSGHLDFYKENMYAPMDIDGQDYYVKPMNCPFHIMIYKSRIRSYRELPIRMAEWGTVYRYERAGVLHGLMRVRGFTQDDAHIFCRPDQMPEEIDKVLQFTLHILRSFGFEEFQAYLSTKPEKAVGSDEMWRDAEAALEEALQRAGLPYEIDEGGGAFYGPKIDLKLKDAIGRTWQCSTIQFDFNLPERFDLTYIGEDGKEHRPYMIHRALMGSMERFFGVMIEHYGGAFPVWLMPVQVRVIPIADRHNDYAQQVVEKLQAAGIRAEGDYSDDRMNAKIRKAQLEKIPYMLIVGDKEMEAGTVSLRTRTGEKQNNIPLDDFIARVQEVVAEKALI
ncbi:MAG: threonine--tRNA ligase [Chloroflexi bacterium]|nr:threonine--tRNA ligase [Chloroflexota bacterium]